MTFRSVLTLALPQPILHPCAPSARGRVRVSRLSLVLCLVVALAGAADLPNAKSKAPRDASEMSADVHGSLFQAPSRVDAGAVTARLAGSLPPAGSAPRIARRNFIDERIFGKMEKDGIPHAALSTDQEFFRRVTLDLTGRIPEAAALRAFLADNSPSKRATLIDSLIGSPAFVDKWSYFYMDLLRANGKMGRGINLFH